jgi:hypothetical protein
MIIGLSGYARSGKDTVAQYLIDEYGFAKYAFADPIKKAMYILNPKLGDLKTYREMVDEYGLEVSKSASQEVRRLLQVFGTEVGRNIFGENIWVDLCLNSIHSNRAVISDVRFPNEADKIKERGGVVWRVNRPQVNALNSHASETSLDDYDFDCIIDNSGTLESLYLSVNTAIVEKYAKTIS